MFSKIRASPSSPRLTSLKNRECGKHLHVPSPVHFPTNPNILYCPSSFHLFPFYDLLHIHHPANRYFGFIHYLLNLFYRLLTCPFRNRFLNLHLALHSMLITQIHGSC